MKIRYLTVVNGSLVMFLSLLLISCTSRYRLELLLISEETQNKVKVEKTEFIANSELNDPSKNMKTRPGNGNCLFITTGSRIKTKESNQSTLISYDDYLRYKLNFQLPSTISAGNTPLLNNAYVNLLGHYDLDPVEKLFFPTGGKMVIDSLTDKYLFIDIDGEFVNKKSNSKISFKGKFKAEFNHND